MVQHRKRPKMVCLSEEEYKALVQARGKYEYKTGRKTSGFGEFVALVAGLYLLDKFVKKKSDQSEENRPDDGTAVQALTSIDK